MTTGARQAMIWLEERRNPMNRQPMLSSGLATLGLALLLLAPPAEARRCDPSGTWLSSAATVTVAPAAGDTFSYIVEIIADDPSFGGMLPADTASLARGSMRRVGQRKFRMSALRHGWNAEGVVWAERAEGTLLLSADCKTATTDVTFNFYSPQQDPFGDDPPAFGSVNYPADHWRIPLR